MSIPLYCDECGECVGAAEAPLPSVSGSTFVGCTGKENHPKPIRTECRKLFGLIKQISLEYPETKTSCSWEAYAGPPSKFKVWLAIVFGTKRWPNGSYQGITINGKWAWWDFKTGFYGDGWKELASL